MPFQKILSILRSINSLIYFQNSATNLDDSANLSRLDRLLLRVGGRIVDNRNKISCFRPLVHWRIFCSIETLDRGQDSPADRDRDSCLYK